MDGSNPAGLLEMPSSLQMNYLRLQRPSRQKNGLGKDRNDGKKGVLGRVDTFESFDFFLLALLLRTFN